MNTQKLFVAATVLLLAGAGSAHASTTTTTLTLDDLFSYSYSPISGNGPKITDDLAKSYKVKLNTSISDKNFFTTAPAISSGLCGGKGQSTCNKTNDTASGTITISLDFTLVETVKNKGTPPIITTLGTGDLTDVTGTYVADYDGNAEFDGASCTSSTGSETDCIVWSGETNGTSITIPVELTNGDDVDVTLFNAQDWDITPKITLDLTACTTDCTIGGHSNATPLPPTLPLFAAGLGAMALLGWRRKRKARALLTERMSRYFQDL